MLVVSFYLSSKHFTGSISEHNVKTLENSNVDVSKLAEGTYSFDVTGDEGEKVVKVVVE